MINHTTARRAVTSSLAAVMTLFAVAAPPPVEAATASPSAIGDAVPVWIAVSPAYGRTGLVIAIASDGHCSSDCVHLWISHDRGDTWQKAQGSAPPGNRAVIAVDAT